MATTPTSFRLDSATIRDLDELVQLLDRRWEHAGVPRSCSRSMALMHAITNEVARQREQLVRAEAK